MSKLEFLNTNMKKIFLLIFALLISSGSANANELPFEYNVSKNSDVQIVKENKELLLESYNFFYNNFKPKNVFVIYFHENDIVESQNYYKKITNNSSLSFSYTKNNCNEASAGIHGPVLGFWQCISGFNNYRSQTTPHEYTHLFQLANGMAEKTSCWIMEGMASYYGNIIGLKDKEKIKEFVLSQINSNVLSEIKSGNTQKYLKSMEEYNCKNNFLLAYSIGYISFELLNSKFGDAAIQNYVLNFRKYPNWNIAFEKTFGLKVEDFYLEVNTYAAEYVSIKKPTVIEPVQPSPDTVIDNKNIPVHVEQNKEVKPETKTINKKVTKTKNKKKGANKC